MNCKILMIILLATVISCGQNYSGGESTMVAPMKSATAPNQASMEEINTIERKIIQEGEVTFETKDAAATRELLIKKLEEFKGYVANDHVYDYKEREEHRVTVRIPAGQFDLLLTSILEEAIKIDNKYVNAQDVTEEFIDVEARLKTKKELEIKYSELLRKATGVKEILDIEKELANVRGEIESMQGRMQYIKDRIAYSTLTVVFYEKTQAPFGFMGKVGQALHNGWNNLLWFSIGMINLWPFVLLLIAGIILFRRYKKWKISKGK